MTHHDPVRILHVTPCPSRIATARDLLIILVCAAILLGTFGELLLPAREPPPPAAPAAARVSL